MNCSLSSDNHEMIMDFVFSSIMKLHNAGKPINMETLRLMSQSVYDVVYSLTNDHKQALYHAAQVLKLVEIGSAQLPLIRDVLKSNGTIRIEVMDLNDSFGSLEEDLSPVEKFLKINAEQNQIQELQRQVQQGVQIEIDFSKQENPTLVYDFKVGDRVQVLTGKKGESIVKEDRGDKVLLEDGRQLLKKNLLKLEPQAKAPVRLHTIVVTVGNKKKKYSVNTSQNYKVGDTFYSTIFQDPLTGAVNSVTVIEVLDKAHSFVHEMSELPESQYSNVAGMHYKEVKNIDDTIVEEPLVFKGEINTDPDTRTVEDLYNAMARQLVEKVKKGEEPMVSGYNAVGLFLDWLADDLISLDEARLLFQYWLSKPGALTDSQQDLITENFEKKEKAILNKQPQTIEPKQLPTSSVGTAPLGVQLIDPAKTTIEINRAPDMWEAIPPTFVATHMAEVLYGELGKLLEYDRIPLKDREFFFKVLRSVISTYEKVQQQILDSSELKFAESEGIYLTAMHVSQLGEYGASTKDPDGLVLVLTDRYGTPLKFDPTAETAVPSETGQIAYFTMIDPRQFLRDNGKLDTDNKLVKEYIRSCARAKKIEHSMAYTQLQKELSFLMDMRKQIVEDTQKAVPFVITGGSMGYIHVDHVRSSPLSDIKNEDLEIRVADDTMQAKSIAYRKGNAYVRTKDLYGQWIPLERPSVKESGMADIVRSLLFDELYDDTGRQLTASERLDELTKFIDVNPKVENANPVKFNIPDPSKAYEYTVTIQTSKPGPPVTFKFSAEVNQKNEAIPLFDELLNSLRYAQQANPKYYPEFPVKENIAEAKAGDIVKVKANEYRKVTHSFRMQLNTHFVDKTINIPVLNTLSNGTVQVTFPNEPITYREFLGNTGFTVMTKDIASDGKLRRANAYVTLNLTDAGAEILGLKAPTPKQQELVEQKTPIQTDEEISPEEVLLNIFEDPKKHKLLLQKNRNAEVTKQQMEEARIWYEKSPLHTKFNIPFNAFFKMVNSKNPNAVAEWALSGITLYKGADYTELYHEAWHAFTQMFLTKTQKEELYDELRKKKGRFTDHTGRVMFFEFATDEQLEEHLAEEFRDYMLNGKKPIKNAPKRNAFFRFINSILEYFFGSSAEADLFANATIDNKIQELFGKLKVGNFSEYTFSAENASFTVLHQGVVAISDNVEGVKQLGRDASNKLNDMMDCFLADFIEARNSSLSEQDMARLAELRTFLSLNYDRLPEHTTTDKEGNVITGRKELQAEIDELLTKNGRIYKGRITKDRALLEEGYAVVYDRMAKMHNSLLEQLESETDPTEKAILQKRFDLLHFAVHNFALTDASGNVSFKIADNRPGDNKTVRGLIGYHMKKSQLFFSKEGIKDLEDAEREEKQLTSREGFDRNGNENSLKSLFDTEMLYLLKTLPDTDKQFRYNLNEFGVPRLAKFETTFNKMVRATENSVSFDDFYKKLEKLGREYTPIAILMQRMGTPYTREKKISEMGLWVSFYQSLAKSRNKLIQMTLRYENGEFSSDVGEAFNADNVVGRMWESMFTSGENADLTYMDRDRKGWYLDTAKVIQQFPTEKDAMDNIFEFYNAIGFKLTPTEALLSRLKNENFATAYTPKYFYDKIKALSLATDGSRFVRTLKTLKEGQEGVYGRLQKLEADHSDLFSNFMVTNAEGNTQFEHSLHNTLSLMMHSLNGCNHYNEVLQKRHLAHLDIREKDEFGRPNPKYNPMAKSSVWLQSMFHLDVKPTDPKWGTRRTHNGVPVSLKLVNLSGALLMEENVDNPTGIASASADSYTKLTLDLHLGFEGYQELMRHADKGTSYALLVDGPIISLNQEIKTVKDRYVPLSTFVNDGYQKLANERILPYLIAELERMQLLGRVQEDIKNGKITEFDFDYLEQGQQFNAFHDVLSKETKDKFTKLLEASKWNDFKTLLRGPELKAMIFADFNKYFEREYQANTELFSKATEGKEPFIADNIRKRLEKDSKVFDKGKQTEMAIRFHTINNWIHNIESLSMIYGDLALYKHAKEEFHKRNAGSGSTGNIYATDQVILDHINDLYFGSYAQMNFDRLGLHRQRLYDGTFNTAIIEDVKLKSAYYDEILKYAGEDSARYNGYKEQTVADAQGFITFDSYRALKISEGTWSDEHQEMYTKINKGEELDPAKVLKFFPVIKAQYFGPLKTNSLPITAFHKYSLCPIIPSVVKNSKMEAIHNRMVKEEIDYIVFQSGSKVGNIRKATGFDKIYKDHTKHGELIDKMRMYSADTTPIPDDFKTDIKDPIKRRYAWQDYIDEPVFTPNVIHLEYLKNQLSIHDTAEGRVIFSTQLRKLIELGLMEDGIPRDFRRDLPKDERLTAWNKLFHYRIDGKSTWDSYDEDKKLEVSKFYTLLENYEAIVFKIAERAKADLLKEISWTEDMVYGDGKNVSKEDTVRLLQFVKSQLEDQDVAEHQLEFINEHHDLSMSFRVEQIEKMLNAVMVKKLIRQRIHGEPLVQVANTFFEEIAGKGEHLEEATGEALSKFGSNDLPFYRPGERTSAMKVKIPFRGDFVHLLKAKDLEGNEIGTLDKLNDLLKNEEWLNKDDHRKMVTMISVRIPVQGLNSMEFMEVYHFMPAEFSGIILPDEIVTKSGADFDIDKMTVMMPSIADINGTPMLYDSNATTLSNDKLKEEKRRIKEEIAVIKDRYREIFRKHDKENEFKFNHLQRNELAKIAAQYELAKHNIESAKKAIKQLEKSTVPYDLERIEKLQDSIELDELVQKKLDEQYDALTKNYNKEIRAELNAKMREELAPLNVELGKVMHAINGHSVRALHNDLISSMRAILEINENYLPLVTPNSTDLFLKTPVKDKNGKVLANSLTELTEPYATEYDRYFMYNEDARVKGKISPTRALEVGYNLYKHDSNAIGKEVLGIGAVDNTYNALFNRVGAFLNPINPITKLRQRILLDHNTRDLTDREGNVEKAISLSDTKDVNGVNDISEVISQLINGWVDIAKGAWIFNIQGNKEVSPVLLFLVQAGVAIEEAVYLVSHPLVKEYVKQQQRSKSTFAKAYGAEPDAYTKLSFHVQLLMNEKYELGLETLDPETNQDRDYIMYQSIAAKLEGQKKFDAEDLRTRSQRATAINIDETDKNIFLHFLELERMANGVRDVKMATNVDTKRDVSLFAAQTRLDKLEDIQQAGVFPEMILEKIMTDSPIKSFFVQDFQIRLLGRLFPFRNMEQLNAYAADNLDYRIVRSTFGDREKAATAFKSDLALYLFTNELKYFDPRKSETLHGVDILPARELAPGVRVDEYQKAKREADARPLETRIPQNLQSGVKKYGTLQEANAEAKRLLGDKPRSIDMVAAGLRTRTTRTDAELKKYNIKEGSYTYMFGESDHGNNEPILVKITKITKGSDPETWYKEGWTEEGFAKLKHMNTTNAVEFEVVKPEQVYLEHGAYVKDGKLYVDYKQLEWQFKNRYFSLPKYSKEFGYATIPGAAFTNFAEYARFVLEREYLRSIYPLQKVIASNEFKHLAREMANINPLKQGMNKVTWYEENIRDTYEKYLRNKALSNTYNNWFLFQSKDSYMDRFFRIVESYPALTEHFSLLTSLKSNERGQYRNLSLLASDPDKDLIEALHENLYGDPAGNELSLINPNSIRELLPTIKDIEVEEITEFFKQFPAVAFLQSGLNIKSALSLTPLISEDSIYQFMEGPIDNLMELLKQGDQLAATYMKLFTDRFKVVNRSRFGRIRGKNYFMNVSVRNLDSIEDAVFSSQELTEGARIAMETLSPEQLEVYKPQREAEFFKDDLVAIPGEKEVNKQTSLYSIEIPVEVMTKDAQGNLVKTIKKTKANSITLKQITDAQPNALFVFESDPNNTYKEGSSGVFARSENAIGLKITKQLDLVGANNYRDSIDKDGNPIPNEDVRKEIDRTVRELVEARDINGMTISFPREGLGQYMLGKDVNGAFIAPKTFIYLSQKLYDHFGYINKGFMSTTSGKIHMQKEQGVTDVEITEVSRQEVLDFMKHCGLTE